MLQQYFYLFKDRFFSLYILNKILEYSGGWWWLILFVFLNVSYDFFLTLRRTVKFKDSINVLYSCVLSCLNQSHRFCFYLEKKMLRVVAFSVLRDWELLGDHTDIAFKIFLYLLICGAALSVLKRYSHWEHPLVDARKEQWERGAVERKYLREKCWRGLLSNWRFFFKGKQLNSLAARDTSTPLWMMITISLRMLSEILSSWICF